jgi:LytS/YehU family sensor histidine kinase
MLYESGKGTITIAEEIKILEDYIDLEKIRYNEKLTIDLIKRSTIIPEPLRPCCYYPL